MSERCSRVFFLQKICLAVSTRGGWTTASSWVHWEPPPSTTPLVCKKIRYTSSTVLYSVADPDVYSSRVPDPTTATEEEEETNLFYLFVATIMTKFNILFLNRYRKKHLSQLPKNYSTFCPKYCHWALKNMGLVSGIRDRDPRSEIGDPSAGIRDQRLGIRDLGSLRGLCNRERWKFLAMEPISAFAQSHLS
jgi:hypothetical protein